MDYEERREVKKQISQLLADAGLNQGRLKEMVEEEIQRKVTRAVEQVFDNLNSKSYSGNFIEDSIRTFLKDSYLNSYACTVALKQELQHKVIAITLKDAFVEKDSDDAVKE